MPAVSPESLREAVAAQRTLSHSVAALLRAVCSQIYAAVDGDDIGPAEALADSIEANPAGWALAVLANTPQAAEAVAVEIDLDHTAGVGDALTPLGHRAERKAAAEAEAKAAHEPEPVASVAEHDDEPEPAHQSRMPSGRFGGRTE